MTAFVPFAEYRPDSPVWMGKYSDNISNVLVDAYGYLPFPAPVTFGSAVASAVRGATAVRLNDRTYDFYAGTKNKLYKFNRSTRVWDDVSNASGYTDIPTDAEWSFAQFGTKLISVQQNVNPQVIDVESGTAFADLGDSPPKAGIVQVVNDFVVLGDILDNPRKIQWSDIDDEADWTEDSGSLAGSQTFPDGGQITAVTTQDSGLVFQTDTARRMVFVPGDQNVFRFEKLGDGLGLRSPYAYAEKGPNTFFLAENGFYLIGPGGIENIGDQKVNNWFFDNVDTQRLWATHMTIDPVYTRAYVAFPSVNGSAGLLDKILVYDWSVQKWTLVSQSLRIFFKAATTATTLEDLDDLFDTLEDVEPSLDSRVWLGGAPILGMFGSDDKIGFFTGTPLEATLDTAEHAFNAPNRVLVNRLHPGVDTTAAQFRVGVRERVADSVTWKSETQMTASGRVPVRAGGRLHRFRCRIPAATSWTHATGVGADFEAAGMR